MREICDRIGDGDRDKGGGRHMSYAHPLRKKRELPACCLLPADILPIWHMGWPAREAYGLLRAPRD
eukprot:scaffold3243_cov106-Isochrysis_galbana.AAC.3